MSSIRWTVYCHIHVESGRRYVGLTKKTMLFRWNQHVQNATKKRGKGCAHFWAAIRKYGRDAFSHEVLGVYQTLEEANAAEQEWIEKLGTRDPSRGFNLMKGGLHVPHPIKNPWDRQEFRAASSEKSRKRWKDPCYRAKIVAGLKTFWVDLEHRKRASEISRSVFDRPGVREKIGDAARGRVFSEETRRKITANMTGRTHVTSPDVKKKISAALKEHFASNPISEETRRKIGESSTGRKSSDETRAKISAAGRSRHISVVRTCCVRGHELTPENVYVNPRGVRECRVCVRSRRRTATSAPLGR